MMIAALLLAAGSSARFGAADKLSAPLGSLPLGRHAAATVLALRFDLNIAVRGSSAPDLPGFRNVANVAPERGISHSIALGVTVASEAGASAILIALADMPLVKRRHFAKLIAHHGGRGTLACSSNGLRRMPPAIFGMDHFAALQSLSGDQGARHLLLRGVAVPAEPGELLDVDTPAQLDRALRELQAIGTPCP